MLSLSREQDIFEDLYGSKPRPKNWDLRPRQWTSKYVLEDKDVLEDFISAKYRQIFSYSMLYRQGTDLS